MTPFFEHPASPSAQKVKIALTEKGVAFPEDVRRGNVRFSTELT